MPYSKRNPSWTQGQQEGHLSSFFHLSLALPSLFESAPFQHALSQDVLFPVAPFRLFPFQVSPSLFLPPASFSPGRLFHVSHAPPFLFEPAQDVLSRDALFPPFRVIILQTRKKYEEQTETGWNELAYTGITVNILHGCRVSKIIIPFGYWRKTTRRRSGVKSQKKKKTGGREKKKAGKDTYILCSNNNNRFDLDVGERRGRGRRGGGGQG